MPLLELRRSYPKLLGCDPRFQLVLEDDPTLFPPSCLPSTVNSSGIDIVAGDGMLPWSEIMAIANKRAIVMPPFGIGMATDPLRRLGLVNFAPEMVELLKFGRGIDNRAFKEVGFKYQYTSAACGGGLGPIQAASPPRSEPKPSTTATKKT